jgi:hypothetical protein
MKTKLILFFSFAFLIGLNAQESSLFYIDKQKVGEKSSISITLTPKDIHTERGSGPFTGYMLYFNEKYMTDTYSIFNATLGGDRETMKLLSLFTRCDFYFDKDFRIYYYYFTIQKKYLPQIIAIEDKLYAFAEKFIEMDISPFVDVYDHNKFQKGMISVNFATFGHYKKHPEKIRYDTYTF